MKTIWIVALTLLAGVAGRALSIAGDWQGTLKAGPTGATPSQEYPPRACPA